MHLMSVATAVGTASRKACGIDGQAPISRGQAGRCAAARRGEDGTRSLRELSPRGAGSHRVEVRAHLSRAPLSHTADDSRGPSPARVTAARRWPRWPPSSVPWTSRVSSGGWVGRQAGSTSASAASRSSGRTSGTWWAMRGDQPTRLRPQVAYGAAGVEGPQTGLRHPRHLDGRRGPGTSRRPARRPPARPRRRRSATATRSAGRRGCRRATPGRRRCPGRRAAAASSAARTCSGSQAAVSPISRNSASLAAPVGAAFAYEIRGCGEKPDEYAIGTCGPAQRALEGPAEVAVAGEPGPPPTGVPEPQPLHRAAGAVPAGSWATRGGDYNGERPRATFRHIA